MKTILLEVNEINFTFIDKYIELGELKNFNALFEKHSYTKTIAENEQRNLEPWIQWVTVHTGKNFDEHKVFRLGDGVKDDVKQIWEVLEEKFDIDVAAISPMNAAAKAMNSAFFMPDPWSSDVVIGSWDLKLLFSAVKQIVNDNAKDKIEFSSYLKLAVGFIPNFRMKNVAKYIKLFYLSRKSKWYKAIFLDRILMDTFITQWQRYQPDFSTLFLNAGAHIQHHYMYNSAVYEGVHENPNWYVDEDADPVLDLYREYDQILGTINELDDVRLMICTALSQVPNPNMTYQYRLNQHGKFLTTLGIDYLEICPRMSRDFLVRFKNNDAAAQAQNSLKQVKSIDGTRIFSVDNRGDNLFCKIDYYGPLSGIQDLVFGEQIIKNFAAMISLASIENGIHTTTGYFVDTGIEASLTKDEIKLAEVYDQIIGLYAAKP
jgi:hypothetical protein